ncbi:hypothetical protein ABH897_002950 [Paenibacillus sp. RC73]|uniref:hypothetical protein n=1 Tax=Paenibacillus sp. RC73 TaxID=3156250 RepID=UPI0038392FC9
MSSFNRSDLGAQASWRGYSSQTLYIASRIVEDEDSLNYYPEQLEDLLIKMNGEVSEVVQVKDLSTNMSMSNLASTAQSLSNEGFFRRVTSLRESETIKIVAKVVHFGELGDELKGFIKGEELALNSFKNKLVKSHGLDSEEAEWLMSRLVFEKVDNETLLTKVTNQIESYVPTMIAPALMQDLLIQYVSDLSKNQQYTSKSTWQEKINQIGRDMASLDGYFREYGGSLIRLSDIDTGKDYEGLRLEYEQGVSAHPAHIRFSLDFERVSWLEKIDTILAKKKAAIVKGASGQGKTSLCYKYLMNNYSEELVFCVRQIQTHVQAENLAKAILGLAKHSDNIILYVDVNPGQLHWTWLLREIQVRGGNAPLLVSIREEDFKQSNIDMNDVAFDLIELSLTKEEALKIYEKQTESKPHELFRTFEEAWQKFGGEGPLLEFMYLLNNHQTLKQRLTVQINRLIGEGIEDAWLNLLLLVCYVGRVDGSIFFEKARQLVQCPNALSALRRMSDEYLIRSSVDGRYIESLHSVRADIIFSILQKEMVLEERNILLQSLACVDNHLPQLLLFHYFTNNEIEIGLIGQIAEVEYLDWVAYGRTLNTMLWLDVKLFVDENKGIFDIIFEQNGSAWKMFAPMDISGEIAPGTFAATDFLQHVHAKEKMFSHLEMVKKSFKSLTLSYFITDKWLELSSIPTKLPDSDLEWSNFGYTFFWAKLRKKKIEIHFSNHEILAAMKEGKIESKIDAALGLYQQGFLELYNDSELILRKRLIYQHKILLLNVTEEEVICHFIPPYFQQTTEADKHKNSNHYWTMNMIEMLNRLYPNKESISVKLVGSDLLKNDLGIESFDHERKISKENRQERWITQVNSWLIMRVQLMHRPDNWDVYLKEIYLLRKMMIETLHDFKGLIEFFYKRQYWNVSESKKFFSKLGILQESMRREMLFPKNIVDTYGISGEGFKDNPNLSLTNSMSTQPYRKYRENLHGLISGLDNFFSQFHEVIAARINNEKVNSNLSLINLYEASKSMFFMQIEFKKLFQPYLDENYFNFADEELNEILINLNMWERVLEQKPIGIGLFYNAKEILKRAPSAIDQSFHKTVDSLNPNITVIDIEKEGSNKRFLLYSGTLSETCTIEDQYRYFCQNLREDWKNARNFNNSKWVLETRWPSLVFVPLYEGLPLFGGYEIPLYRIISMYEAGLPFTLFPVELPEGIYALYDLDSDVFERWRKAITDIGTIRLMLIQYNQIVEEVSSLQETEVETLVDYFSTFMYKISEHLKSATNIIQEVADLLSDCESPELFELMNGIVQGVGALEFLQDDVGSLLRVEDIPESLLQATLGMILLTPYLKKF